MKYCEHCLSNNYMFYGEPLQLDESRILCCKCAEPIMKDLDEFANISKQTDFDKQAAVLISKCKENFDDILTCRICNYINNKYKNSGFSPIEYQPEFSVDYGYLEDYVDLAQSSSTEKIRNINEKTQKTARLIVAALIGIAVICGIIFTADYLL